MILTLVFAIGVLSSMLIRWNSNPREMAMFAILSVAVRFSLGFPYLWALDFLGSYCSATGSFCRLGFLKGILDILNRFLKYFRILCKM